MNVTKEVLDTINWKAITVFPKEYLVVLECGNYKQSSDLMKILLANNFHFKIGDGEFGLSLYIINFVDSGLQKVLPALDERLFKYFIHKQINWLTTGFNTKGDNIACLDDRIDISGMNYYELN